MMPNAHTPQAGYEHAQGLYPSPPESIDSPEHSTHANVLGLAGPPTALLYPKHCFSPSHLNGESLYFTTITAAAETEQLISVSTSFYPGSHPLESDLILCSIDGIHFYVHTHLINKASLDALPAFLGHSLPALQGEVIAVPETGILLNIILHAIYDTSVAKNSPTCAQLIEAVDKLPQYGLVPSKVVRPETSLYQLLLTHAPFNPMPVYTVAAHHDIFDLAKQASSHLLSFRLDEIDDPTAIRMGPVYLKRLFLLQSSRMEAAKKVILQSPGFHPASKKCTFEDQKRVRRAWSLGSTYLAWELRPDLSSHRIKSVFEPLVAELDCIDCQGVLNKRIRDVLVSLARLKCTI